ncbi:hypothetical protein DIPPA_33073 [Diplonema papillatum]|nr:hypothetical protein DIPPA_33073 [Diplonema papillatum]
MLRATPLCASLQRFSRAQPPSPSLMIQMGAYKKDQLEVTVASALLQSDMFDNLSEAQMDKMIPEMARWVCCQQVPDKSSKVVFRKLAL